MRYLCCLLFITMIPMVIGAKTSRLGQIDFRPSYGDDLRGRVTDLYGSPISGASVRARSITSEKATVADIRGNYSFAGLGPGVAEITVRSGGFREETVSVAIEEGHPVMLDIGLDGLRVSPLSPFLVSGSVKDPRGRPVAEAVIEIINIANPRIRFSLRSGNNGTFHTRIFSGGIYVLLAGKRRPDTYSTPLIVGGPGSTGRVRIVLRF